MFPAVVALVVVIGIVLVVVSSGGGGGAGGSGEVEIAKQVAVQGEALPGFTGSRNDAAIGAAAPVLTGVGFNGKQVTIAPTGTPYVVAFVAHWCPHCQAEVPRIVDLEHQGATAGIKVVAVATGTSSGLPNYPPSAWLTREHWPFPVLVDTADATAATAYGLQSYPFLVYVDAAGKVVGRTAGEIGVGDLGTLFRALAAGEALPLPGTSGASSSR